MVLSEKWHAMHDYFNLLTIPFICAATVYFLYTNEERCFWISYFVFLSYIAIDTIWVIIIPQSVASPATIIIHHIITILGWNIPVFNGFRYTRLSNSLLLVEFNTWFLIARRNFRESNFLNAMFLATWIALRLIMYPVLLVNFVPYYIQDSTDFGTYINSGVFVLVIVGSLTALNMKWSFDLFMKLWRGKSGGSSSEKQKHLRGL